MLEALSTAQVKAFGVRNLLPMGTGKTASLPSGTNILTELRVSEVLHALLHIHPSRPNRGG